MSVRRIGAEERRARLAIRHHLAPSSRARELAQWLGPVRVTPHFRTPLERELVA
jgi:hypothetical protein